MLNIALVGCGRIAVRHYQLLGKGQIAGALLCSVWDIIEEKAKMIGSEYELPYFTYTSWRRFS